MADTDMGVEAPETRPIPALPGHPSSPGMPDFHMTTKALPQQESGLRRSAEASPQPPKTQPCSQVPSTTAAQRGIIFRSRRRCENYAAKCVCGGGPHRCQNTFCSNLAVLKNAWEKCVRGAGGKGKMPSKSFGEREFVYAC